MTYLATVYRRFQSIFKTVLSYCLKYRKNRESKNRKVERTKNGRIVFLSKCALCNSKNIEIFQRARILSVILSGVLSSLKIKIPLRKISLVSSFLF